MAPVRGLQAHLRRHDWPILERPTAGRIGAVPAARLVDQDDCLHARLRRRTVLFACLQGSLRRGTGRLAEALSRQRSADSSQAASVFTRLAWPRGLTARASKARQREAFPL